LIDFSKFVKEK